MFFKGVINAKDDSKKILGMVLRRIIYTMVNMTTCMINDTMRVFEERSNVEKEHPGVLAMKNEFLYDSILVTPAKKHYQSAVRVQEGVYFEKPKFDIKGMEYTKNSMKVSYIRIIIKYMAEIDIEMTEFLFIILPIRSVKML